MKSYTKILFKTAVINVFKPFTFLHIWIGFCNTKNLKEVPVSSWDLPVPGPRSDDVRGRHALRRRGEGSRHVQRKGHADVQHRGPLWGQSARHVARGYQVKRHSTQEHGHVHTTDAGHQAQVQALSWSGSLFDDLPWRSSNIMLRGTLGMQFLISSYARVVFTALVQTSAEGQSEPRRCSS